MNEKNRFFTAEQEICISSVTVMSGIRPAGRSVDHRAHGRRKNGLLYLWEGCARFAVDGAAPLNVGTGDLVFIPKGYRYQMCYSRENTAFVLVDLELSTPDGAPCVLFDHIRVLAHDGGSRHIAGMMAKLEQCSAAENAAALFRRKELVYRLFSVVLGNNTPTESYQPKYANIVPGVLLLQQTYLENIPITAFAEACKISESSFRGLFTAQYGLSPIQYRNRLRVQRAQAILAEGSSTVAEAAYASGFENISYFCRYYKRIVGETPRETQQKSMCIGENK